MRLWHESLIPYLPRQQLLGQHRECCALRGLGWGRPHATVNYVFQHPYEWLVLYHYKVMMEMLRRGYGPNFEWFDYTYRGKSSDRYIPPVLKYSYKPSEYKSSPPECEGENQNPIYIYPEHNDEYLQECLDNLRSKGIEISP